MVAFKQTYVPGIARKLGEPLPRRLVKRPEARPISFMMGGMKMNVGSGLDIHETTTYTTHKAAAPVKEHVVNFAPPPSTVASPRKSQQHSGESTIQGYICGRQFANSMLGLHVHKVYGRAT